MSIEYSPEHLALQMEQALRKSMLIIQRSVLDQQRANRTAEANRLYQDRQISFLRSANASR